MAFDSPDLNLGSVLTEIGQGKIQLPDFQREWKWDDDRIASLLASVGRGHPVGVLMLLETGGDGASFAPKPIAGAKPPAGISPEQLVLDGQQRLTSLFQALTDGRPVDTTDVRGKRMKRWYYVSMAQALDGPDDLDDAVISVPEDRKIRDNFGKNVVADYSTPDEECAAEMFPLRIIFDMPAIFAWQRTYLDTASGGIGERNERWNRFYTQVLANFIQYMVPAIVLKKDTPKEAVCTVFEKVNTGGVPLNVFELLTATFAADNYRLKDDWADRKARLDKRHVLRSLESTDFLQTIALLATTNRKRAFEVSGAAGIPPGIGCKRRDILALKLDEYQKWAEPVTQALDWAANFLNQEHLYSANDLPYRTQLVPLAAIRVDLGGEADKIGVKNLMRQWYWSGVLGELYGGATETRFARDMEQVPPWVTGGAIPNTVADGSFREQRLLTLRTRNSAAYKGIYALLMRNGSPDWMKAEPMNMATFFSYQVDIHHIFPKSWSEKNGIDHARRESIVNKTAISRSTNISIGGRSPADYVTTLENKAGISSGQLDEILESHEISPGSLRSANFDEFFADRKERLLKLISEAMGKEAIREIIEVDEATAGYEDEPEELGEELEPEEAELTTSLVEAAEASTEHMERLEPQRRAWDEKSFIAAAESDQGVEAAEASRAILAWANERGLRLWYGDGTIDASVLPMLDVGGQNCFTFGLRSAGGIELQFKWMRPPFATFEARRELQTRLNALPHVVIPDDRVERLPKLPWTVVEDPQGRAAFLEIFDWVIFTTREHFLAQESATGSPLRTQPSAISPATTPADQQATSSVDEPPVPAAISDFIRGRASGPLEDVALEFARRLSSRGGLELRTQNSRNEPWYFQVRTPQFRQVLAYVNVSPTQIRVDYRLPKDHDTYGKAIARDNFYGIALRLQDMNELDLAMELIEDALARPD